MPSDVKVRSGKVRVVWDDFTGGEFGSLSPDRAPASSFTGSNVIVNEAGQIIPRSGLTPFLTATGAVTSWPAGKTVRHLGVCEGGAGSSRVVYVVDSDGKVRSISSSGVVSAAYAGSAIDATSMPQYPVIELNRPDGKATILAGQLAGVATCFFISHTAGTVATTTINGLSRGPTSIVAYQDRNLVSDGVTTVAYSDPLAVTFPAANYFISPGNGGVAAMLDMHTFLLIGCTAGEWWALHGTPGTGNDSFHRVFNSPSTESGPVDAVLATPNGAVVNGQQAWFLPNEFTNNDGYPAMFTGSSVRDFRHLGSIRTPGGQVFALGRPNGVAYVQGRDAGDPTRAYVRHNGVWTLHLLRAPSGSLTSHVCPSGGALIFCDNSAVPKLFRWDPGADNTPPGSSRSPGLDGTASFTSQVSFPNVWAPDDQQWGLRKVAVDMLVYDNGTSDPTLTVGATVLGRNNATTAAVSTQQFTSARAGFSTSGTEWRYVFSPDEPIFGAGCRISLTGINAVAVRRVTASFEVRGLDA